MEASIGVSEAEKEKLKIVNIFSKKILDKYRDIVKCVVLFGEHEVIQDIGRDIDVFIVLDDTAKHLSLEELKKIQEDINNIAEECSDKLSVQPPFPLTQFWDNVRKADPIIYNIIKTGRPIYDLGFFLPIQRLLQLGKIPLTREQIINLIEDAPKKIGRAETVKLLMLAEDCYYAMLNTTQAVLMWLNVPPPAPSKAYDYTIEYLVKPGHIPNEFAEWLKGIIEIRKKIENRELTNVSGQFVDEWLEKTKKYVERMYILHSNFEFQTKTMIIKRAYEVMTKAFRSTLEFLKKLPENEEMIPEAFKNEVIDKRIIEDRYYELWKELVSLKKLIDEEKFEDINALPYEKALYLREEVRRMLHTLAKKLEKREKELGEIEEHPLPE